MTSTENTKTWVYSAMPITAAVNEVQLALSRLKNDSQIQNAGIQFSKAVLTFVVSNSFEAEAEVGIKVVTAGGSIGRQSTSTIVATLEEPGLEAVELTEREYTNESIQELVRQLAAIVLLGGDKPYPLAFSEGSVELELIVTAEGHLKVATEGLVVTVLRALGLFNLSVQMSVELLKTSSIKLHYTRAT
ncbi:MAG: hypothetical protein IT334_12265 [Thermomicrobiales bacterium]|nr:hypothetical protein [Thermomicrobiales bacterium]